jgi:hypothetical protein
MYQARDQLCWATEMKGTRMLFRISAISVLLTATVALHAANVFNVTGPLPFGISGELADAISWSQTSGYTNVTITMPLEDTTSGGPIGGVEGTVYLMNQVGPGTTAANQVFSKAWMGRVTMYEIDKIQ